MEPKHFNYVTKTEIFLAVVSGLLHAYFVHHVYNVVSEPYMDEEFHVNQTRSYCAGEYLVWNSKITTPPALYLLAVPFFCGAERYLNSAILPFCFLGICALRKKWHKELAASSILTSLNILTLPVLLDTSILFYTDLLSLTAVVWAYVFEKRPIDSTLCFVVAVLTRQTNIVWAGMFFFTLWYKNIIDEKPRALIKNTFDLFLRYWPHILLGVTFLGFVYLNKGIVLGDKSAHTPVFHGAQFLYFLGFTALSSLPFFVSHILQSSTWEFFSCKIALLGFTVLFSCVIFSGTLTHPYLLADNRHFTFYLWRKFFAKHWSFKYLLIPFYAQSFVYVMKKMKSLPYFIFLPCVCACIVPAHLVEFRYFIVPYALWRLSVIESNTKLLYLELAFSFFVNFVALYLFFKKPFVWSHDSTMSVQRFMW